jgi:hypothetical protein
MISNEKYLSAVDLSFNTFFIYGRTLTIEMYYVSQYLVYMRTGTAFSSLINDQTDLIDIQPANVNTGFYPTDLINGRNLGLYPPYFTPQYAGTFYFKIYAQNSLNEVSSPTLGSFVLTSQAPLDRVNASGINVLS